MLYVPTKHVDVYMKIPDHEEGNDFNQPTKVQTVWGNEHEIWIVIYCTVIKTCIPKTQHNTSLYYLFPSQIFAEIKCFSYVHHKQTSPQAVNKLSKEKSSEEKEKTEVVKCMLLC